MSHVTDVKLNIKDLDALEETLAARFPQLELRRDQATFKWYGKWMNDFHGANAAADNGYDSKTFGRCEHAIGIRGDKSAYEIGLVARAGEEGWNAIYDTWDHKLDPIVGAQANALKREYAATVATNKAVARLSRHGWRVQREDLPGNRIRLKLRKR